MSADFVLSFQRRNTKDENEENYENPDGSPITFDTDFFGNKRAGSKVLAGPFAEPGDAKNPLF